MNGNHSLPGGILRQLQILGECGVRCIGGHPEPAGGVVASGRTHRIHEYLVPLVEDAALNRGIGRELGTPAPASVVEFVEALEYEPVAAILEACGDLGPDRRHLFAYLRLEGRAGGGVLDVQPLICVGYAVILVVVGVHDDVQPSFMRPEGNLVYPVQPGGVDRIIRGGAYHPEPRNRDAHAGETRGLYFGESGRCSLCVPPYFLVRITFLVARP